MFLAMHTPGSTNMCLHGHTYVQWVWCGSRWDGKTYVGMNGTQMVSTYATGRCVELCGGVQRCVEVC